jgi:hypothetical protein
VIPKPPALPAAGASCAAQWIDANVAINQLQSIGTHNSYKVAIPENEMALIRRAQRQLGDALDYRPLLNN